MRKISLGLFFACISFISNASVPTSGLIGYWPFSGNANDASGHGHNGIVTKATLTSDVSGQANSAYRFAGNDFITIPYHADFDFSKTKQFSYGCWILNDSGTDHQVYIGKDAPNCSNFAFNLEQLTDGGLVSNMHGSSCWNNYYTEQQLGAGQWHHVLVTSDSVTMKVYLDGSLIQISQVISPMFGNYVSDIVIGAFPSYHGNTAFMKGKIDEMVLYNRALRGSEVTTIYTDTKPKTLTIPTNNLIGYWPFNGNANDESGHGHNGIVTNAALTSDAAGYANSAYRFAGNDFITIPYHADFDFSKTKQFSYGCWILNDSGTDHQVYIGKDAPNCSNFAFNLEQLADGGLITNMHGSYCWYTYNSAKQLGTGKWRHVLVTADSLIMKVYLDGNLIKTNPMTSPMFGNYVSDIVFGAWPGYSGNDAFIKGKIDEVVLYNRALIGSEVTTIYSNGINSGIESATSSTSIRIFPVPTRDYLTVACDEFSQEDTYLLKISNTASVVLNTTAINQKTSMIDLSTYPAGMYFIQITDKTGNTLKIEKIIKL